MNLTFLTVIMITQNHQLKKKMKRMVMTTMMVIHSNILPRNYHSINPLSPNIQIQILQTGLHTFP